MQVRLLFFATLKDIVGSREMRVEVPHNCTVEDLLNQLEQQYPQFVAYRSILLTAVNEEYVGRSSALAEGDEVAIFPPVSGGSR